MTLIDFLAPWPLNQEIRLYTHIPEVPLFWNKISELKFSDCVGFYVVFVQYVDNVIFIKVSRHG